MKTITCLDCDQEFAGETPEQVMEQMMPHYMNDHKDIMDAGTEEQRDGWLVEFNKRWDAAPEL